MAIAMGGFINNEYQLGAELGRGSFSSVYAATDKHGGLFAVKTEKRDSKKRGLRLEANVYFKVREDARQRRGYPHGVPRMYHYEEDVGGHRVLVMEQLGKSLADRIQDRQGALSLKSVLMAGIQAVSRLEYLHGLGVLHRDVKPDNLLTGVGATAGRVYLADFGLACAWGGDRAHVADGAAQGFFGTVRYAPVRAHARRQQSRGCDLESLAYALVFAATRRLPWVGLQARDSSEKERKVGEMKRGISATALCQGLPSAFAKFVREVRSYEFATKPDYRKLRKLFVGSLRSRGMENDRQFDWMDVKKVNLH